MKEISPSQFAQEKNISKCSEYFLLNMCMHEA